MTQFSDTTRRALAGLALSPLFVLGTAANAFAEECGDLTCEAGFTCNVYENEGCAEIDCPEGEDCATCEPAEPFYSCDRAACESDADCGDYMVCGTFPNYCEDGPCEDPDYQQCAARWDLPCETAADCGEGFRCEGYEVCDCEAVAVPADGSETELVAPACDDCRMSDEQYCVQEQIPCETASDCPADWTCDEGYFGTCDAEGNCDESLSTQCQPPWDKVWGPSSGGVILEASGGAADGEIVTTAAGTLGDTPEAAEAEVASDAEDVEEAAAPGARDEEAAAPESEEEDAVAVDDDETIIDDEDEGKMNRAPTDGENASSGCSVAAAPSNPTGLGWLALGLGLAATALRRTRRQNRAA